MATMTLSASLGTAVDLTEITAAATAALAASAAMTAAVFT